MAKSDSMKRTTKAISPQWLERPRLLEPLAQAQDKRLIAILAPSGYGKTTLLKQHTERSSRQTMWLTLRDDAADADALARDTIYALQQVVPKLRFPQTNKALSIEARANRLGVTLARDLNVINANLNLVFDRIEHLSETSAGLIQALVEEIGEGHQILVAGYEGNPLSVARFAVDGMALAIEASQLNFTPEETAALLTARGFQGNIEQTHEQMAGWSLGIAMIANGSADVTQPSQIIESLLSRLPKSMQAWLPELAVLEVWSVELARDVGCQVPDTWFHEVITSGLPIIPLNNLEYQPHLLLSNRLNQVFSLRTDRYKIASFQAAKVAEKKNRNLTAIQLYQTAGALSEAMRVMSEFTLESSRRGDTKLLQKIAESIPENILTEELLIFINGNLLQTNKKDEAKSKLFNLYQKGSRNPLLLFCLARIYQMLSQPEKMRLYINEIFEQKISEDQKYKALTMKAAALHLERSFKESQDCLEEALLIAKKTGKSADIGSTLCNLAMIYQNCKEFNKAEKLYKEAQVHFEMIGARSLLAANYSNMLDFYSRSGQYDKFDAKIEEALSLAKRLGDFWAGPIMLTDFICDFYRGKLNTSKTKGELAIKTLANTPYKNMVHYCRCYLIQIDILLGNLDQIDKKINDYLLSCDNDDIYRGHLIQGVRSFSIKKFQDSIHFFNMYNNVEHLNPIDYIRALFYQTEALRRSGKAWKKALDKAFKRLDHLKNDDLLRIDETFLGSLYTECIRRGLYRERVQKSMGFQSLEGKTSVIKLSIETFNNVKFSISNLKVHVGLQKSKEVLLWLGIRGSSSRPEIIKALWNSDTSQNREYFKIVVRKLRTALLENTDVKGDPVQFENGLYQLHSTIELQWDFKLLINRFRENNWTNADLETVSDFSNQFMTGMTSEWIRDFKQGVIDSLYSTLMDTLEQLDAPRAISVCEAAIALDPLSEKAYVALAKHLRQTGMVEEAKHVPIRFKAALET
jgi:LuxR family transcriptional regulator, maltose regulon positive regulatory protein